MYVPTVSVIRSTTPPTGSTDQGWLLRLDSNFMGFNLANEPKAITLVAWFDENGRHDGYPAGGSNFLAPGKAGLMNAGVCSSLVGQGCVSIAQLRVGDGIAVRDTLERSLLVGPSCIPLPDGGLVSQGRIPLPVFEGLYAAGTITASGDVMPYNAGGLQVCSNQKDQKYVRRLNLTLFNGGKEPATFVVKGYRSVFDPPTIVFTSTFGVGPETVEQFNSFYAPPISSLSYPHEENLWFTITADQPFLAYISTIFEDPGPGVNPYQIFPALTK